MKRPLLLLLTLLPLGCTRKSATTPEAPHPAFFQVDPATAGVVTGVVRYVGRHPAAPVPVDMASDPACVAAHPGKPTDESLLLDPHGNVGNAFVFIRTGLEGKVFPTPTQPVTIDQRGCWFHPRVLGIQTGQSLEVVNSDPVTHNIHPMAVSNREWNHSQAPGDAPLRRKFLKPEIMVPVKCNIHGWMHAWIGVLDHPYFAVTAPDGTYKLPDLPPGAYTLTVWQEKLGTREQQILVGSHAAVTADILYKDR